MSSYDNHLANCEHCQENPLSPCSEALSLAREDIDNGASDSFLKELTRNNPSD